VTSPTSQATAPSKFMTQVAFPASPILCSMRSPRNCIAEDTAAVIGKMCSVARNSESPFDPAGAPLIRASTSVNDVVRKIMVAGRYEDFRTCQPILFGCPILILASIRMSPRSVPAWDSDRSIVTVQLAADDPRADMCQAGLAMRALSGNRARTWSGPHTSSSYGSRRLASSHKTANMTCGRPWPPNDESQDTPGQPSSQYLRYASTKPGGDFDRAIFESAANPVPDGIQRCEDLGCEPSCLDGDPVHQLGIHLGEFRYPGECARRIEYLMQDD